MKTSRRFLVLIVLLLAGGRSLASEIPARTLLTPDQIEALVSPIALYPDPLVALILPASTRPSDIVLAARFLENGGDPEQTATEPWDDSVKALARYRELLAYLDQNLAWTRSLGDCFADQPDAVMDAVQRVRVRARAAGLLTDSSEQSVIVESDEIRIVPSDPTVIYVPRYSPEVLYVRSFPFYYSGPFLTFGVGYRVGSWLNYDCDWRYHIVRVVHRPEHWYRQPDWRAHRPNYTAGPVTSHRWVPSPRHDRHFDPPKRNAGPRGYPERMRPESGSFNHVPPITPHREAVRPFADHNRSPNSAATARPGQAPAFRPSAGRIPSPDNANRYQGLPRPARGDQPSRGVAEVRPPPPRMNAAPARQYQPPAPARRTEPSTENRDRASDGRPGSDRRHQR